MLVLQRRPGERIVISLGDGRIVTVEVVDVHRLGGAVRLGFTADRSIPIVRGELREEHTAPVNQGDSK